MNNNQHQPASQGQEYISALAVTSLVLGILAATGLAGERLLLSVAAIVLACIDRSRTGKFSGVALGGLICGIIGICFILISLLISIIWWGFTIELFKYLMSLLSNYFDFDLLIRATGAVILY